MVIKAWIIYPWGQLEYRFDGLPIAWSFDYVDTSLVDFYPPNWPPEIYAIRKGEQIRFGIGASFQYKDIWIQIFEDGEWGMAIKAIDYQTGDEIYTRKVNNKDSPDNHGYQHIASWMSNDTLHVFAQRSKDSLSQSQLGAMAAYMTFLAYNGEYASSIIFDSTIYAHTPEHYSNVVHPKRKVIPVINYINFPSGLFDPNLSGIVVLSHQIVDNKIIQLRNGFETYLQDSNFVAYNKRRMYPRKGGYLWPGSSFRVSDNEIWFFNTHPIDSVSTTDIVRYQFDGTFLDTYENIVPRDLLTPTQNVSRVLPYGEGWLLQTHHFLDLDSIHGGYMIMDKDLNIVKVNRDLLFDGEYAKQLYSLPLKNGHLLHIVRRHQQGDILFYEDKVWSGEIRKVGELLQQEKDIYAFLVNDAYEQEDGKIIVNNRVLLDTLWNGCTFCNGGWAFVYAIESSDLNLSSSVDDITPNEVISLKLYPNPSSGLLNIGNWEYPADETRVMIISLDGKIVSESYLNPSLQLDISEIPAAWYNLRLTASGRVASGIFLKID